MPAYEELESEVIEAGLCTYCGACIASCPLYHLKWIDGAPKRPEVKSACEDCETCYNACYRTKFERVAIEAKIFGRPLTGNEDIGIYRRVIAARATDGSILENAQDGGVVTAILVYMLEHKMIDGAVLTGRDESWAPFPTVAKSKEEIIVSAGTKYGISPNLMKIRTAVIDEMLDNICVVGLPCHVQAMRHLQQIKFDLSPAIKFVIGLFCRENYEYDALKGYIESTMHDISKVRAFSVVEDAMLVHFDDETSSIPITGVKRWVPRHCLLCHDFASELADISVGCDGSPGEFSTVIIRTDSGERIFTELVDEGALETTAADIDTIREIANRKKEKAAETAMIYALRDDGRSVEEIARQLRIAPSTVMHRLEKY